MTSDDEQYISQAVARLRREEPELGHLVAAIGFKRALVEKFGIEFGFAAARPHLGVPGLEVLKSKAVVRLRDMARQAPEFTLLWEGGQPFVHLPPPVIGDGDHAPQHGISRSGYLTCLEDVSIRGRSAIVLTDTKVIVDFENAELQGLTDSPEFDPGILWAGDETWWAMEPAEYTNVVDEAFMLTGSHTNDFGHWLTEYLPKLAIALAAGLPQMPILVDQKNPRSHVESLRLLCPWARIIVLPHRSPCRVRRLWCASNPVYRGFYPFHSDSAWGVMLPDPDNFAFAIRKLKQLAAAAIAKPTGSGRVFLARRPSRKKKLVNHAQIEAAAAARDFVVVYPEDLPFVEQLRLVHHARHIVAPDGSAGLLAYFVSPGAKVCFLNSPNTLPLVELNGLLSALGAGFTVVTGPMTGEPSDEPFWNDYSIDPDRFCAFLDDWLVDVDETPRLPIDLP